MFNRRCMLLVGDTLTQTLACLYLQLTYLILLRYYSSANVSQQNHPLVATDRTYLWRLRGSRRSIASLPRPSLLLPACTRLLSLVTITVISRKLTYNYLTRIVCGNTTYTMYVSNPRLRNAWWHYAHARGPRNARTRPLTNIRVPPNFLTLWNARHALINVIKVPNITYTHPWLPMRSSCAALHTLRSRSDKQYR